MARGTGSASESTPASRRMTSRPCPCSYVPCAICQCRGWKITLQIQDIASGVSNRPVREELLRLARQRCIDMIIVWRLDRWGRSVVDLLNTLQELHSLDVGFVSLTEALDFTTPAGRAMAAMLSVFAEFEREVLAPSASRRALPRPAKTASGTAVRPPPDSKPQRSTGSVSRT